MGGAWKFDSGRKAGDNIKKCSPRRVRGFSGTVKMRGPFIQFFWLDRRRWKRLAPAADNPFPSGWLQMERWHFLRQDAHHLSFRTRPNTMAYHHSSGAKRILEKVQVWAKFSLLIRIKSTANQRHLLYVFWLWLYGPTGHFIQLPFMKLN